LLYPLSYGRKLAITEHRYRDRSLLPALPPTARLFYRLIDSAMPFHMLSNNPFNRLHFSLDLFQVLLVCHDAPRQTASSVSQDVVYVFAHTFVRVWHSRIKFGTIFMSEKSGSL